MIQGLKIIDNRAFYIDKQRLSKSSGTCFSLERNPKDEYENFSFLPRLPWHPVVDPKYFLTQKIDRYWIAIIEVPQELKKLVTKLMKIVHVENRSEYSQRLLSPLHEFTSELCTDKECLFNFRIGCSFPGQASVTLSSIGQKIGLHIDNHLELPRHRILLNFGPSIRYFIFIDLPIDYLKEYLQKTSCNQIDNYGRTAIGQVFMKLFPKYPVMRIKINPGEAYIAPTEHIIHDGSTEDFDMPSFYVTGRSIFDGSIVKSRF